jgi:PAS domain S-box-containing protein
MTTLSSLTLPPTSNCAPLGVISLDGDHRVLHIDDGIAVCFDALPVDYRGQPLGHVLPQLTHEIGELLDQVGGTFAPTNHRLISSFGEKLWWVLVEPVVNRGGAVLGVDVIVYDGGVSEPMLAYKDRLATVLEAVDLIYIELDLKNGRVCIDGACEQLIARPLAERFYDLNDLIDLIHSEDRGLVSQLTSTCLAYQNVHFEFRSVQPSGEIRWLSLRARWLPDSSSSLRLVGIIADATDARRAVESLRVSEARYRALAATAQIVWTTSSNGGVDDAPSWRAFTGQTPEEVRGLGWLHSVHPADREDIMRRWAEAVAEQRVYVGQHRVRRYDGVYRRFFVQAAPVIELDGRVREWIGTSTDITDSTHAVHSIRFLSEASTVLAAPLDDMTTFERVTQLVTDQLADGCGIYILGTQPEGRWVISTTNPAAQTVFDQLSRLEGVSSGLPALLRQVLESGKAELLFPGDVVAGAAQLASTPFAALTSCIVAPLRHHQHSFGVIVFALTGNDRRYDMADLALAEELGRRIGVTMENVLLFNAEREARMLAEEAVKIREQFLSVAAHELKTPLTSVLGYAEVLQRRLTTSMPTSEQEQRMARIIVEQTTRLYTLISSLLDITKIQVGQMTITRLPINLGALVQRVAESVQAITDVHTIRCDLPDDNLVIYADELRLEQVFLNLIHNAIKYTPSGGQIQVQLGVCEDWLEVAIIDQGIGIPKDSLPLLFQRFYRAPNVDSEQIGGLGVGLFVAKEIVAFHGGQIVATSYDGQGSTFIVRLPRSAADSCE